MKYYKVVALSVGAKSNKIFKSGDIVTEDAFHEGHAQQLVEQGFLVVHDAAESTPNPAVKHVGKSSKEPKAKK